ncbi:MAG: HAD family phosphatase [Firmicutes bacterium]|nr:HAD family phosphatase [Bacillota bacterium]
MKENIKLIASDLDGTLLDNRKKITPELFCALSHLSEKGVLFVPATGRPLGSIPQNVLQIPKIRYIISSNGAAVNDVQNKKDVIRFCLKHETALEIVDMSQNTDAMLELFSNGEAYTEKRFLDSLEYGLSPTHAAYLLSTRKPIENAFDFLEENRNDIENINLIFRDISVKNIFRNELKKLDAVSITSSSPMNIEITDAKATKGGALKALCKKLNIDSDNVMAFGDNSNDEDMISFARFGIAMSNGEDHIKKIAAFTTLSCDENGVFEALKKFGVV